MALNNQSLSPNSNARIANWIKIALPPLIIFVVVLVLWQMQVFHALLNIKTFQLPLPSDIIDAAGRRGYDLWVGANYTLLEIVLGLIIGSAAGFAVALFCVWFNFARRGILPLAITSNAMPIIAFVPIMSRWFGFDQPTRIAVVTTITFAPMLVSAYKGFTSLDSNSMDLMRSYAAGRWQIFLKLQLPASLPYVFSALKIGTTAATIGAVVAEYFKSAGGIGDLISNNIQSNDFALAWCGIVVVIIMGLGLYLIVSLIERFSIPWQRSLHR